jgi:hypothetical protein
MSDAPEHCHSPVQRRSCRRRASSVRSRRCAPGPTPPRPARRRLLGARAAQLGHPRPVVRPWAFQGSRGRQPDVGPSRPGPPVRGRDFSWHRCPHVQTRVMGVTPPCPHVLLASTPVCRLGVVGGARAIRPTGKQLSRTRSHSLGRWPTPSFPVVDCSCGSAAGDYVMWSANHFVGITALSECIVVRDGSRWLAQPRARAACNSCVPRKSCISVRSACFRPEVMGRPRSLAVSRVPASS